MKILKFLLPLMLLVSLSSCSYVVEVKDKLFDKNDKKGELASSPEDEAPPESLESETEASTDDASPASEDDVDPASEDAESK